MGKEEISNIGKAVDISASTDSMKAYFSVRKDRGAFLARMTRPGFAEYLIEGAKLSKEGLIAEAVESTYMSIAKGEYEKAQDILICEGRPPQRGDDARIEWARDFFRPHVGDMDKAATVNYHASQAVDIVHKGEKICTVIPPTNGEPGFNVHYEPIPADAGKDAIIRWSENIRASADHQVFYAVIPGKLEFRAERLDIDRVYNTIGDVDFSTGNIDFPGSIDVAGSLRDNFQIRAGENVAIHGVVEGAWLEAGGNVEIKGGIHGRDKCFAAVKGNLTTKYLNNASIEVSGDIRIELEALNSRTTCSGRIELKDGKISGGRWFGTEGMDIAAAGAETSVETLLAVGVDPLAERELEEVRRQHNDLIASIAEINEKVEAFRGKLGELPEKARAKVGKLYTHMNNAQLRADNLLVRREYLAEKSRPRYDKTIIIRDEILPGVHIRIGEKNTRMSTKMRGPMKIGYSEKKEEFYFLPL